MKALTIADLAGQTCQFDGCDETATTIACGRESHVEEYPGHPIPGLYCLPHAKQVADEQYPEYEHECVNCGCLQGVN